MPHVGVVVEATKWARVVSKLRRAMIQVVRSMGQHDKAVLGEPVKHRSLVFQLTFTCSCSAGEVVYATNRLH